jgi:CBS domain-containing protein
MNLLAPISQIMTPHPITISPDDNLQKAQEIFENNAIHHIPVMSMGKLVGMLTKSDFSFFKRTNNSAEYDKIVIDVKLKNTEVKSVMTTRLGKLDVDDRINVALDIFRRNLFHALPVMDGDTLVGIVTTHDIIRLIAEEEYLTKSYL